MNEHKQEIISTRVGCVGGSDANMLSQIDKLGFVPRTAYKRMAICNGLAEPENISTRAMALGDFIEDAIFNSLSSCQTNGRYESNPLWVSNKYSREHCKLICHVDFVLFDEENKTIHCYECKATRYNPKATKMTYRKQMYIEWLLAKEEAIKRGADWKVKLTLCHYDTDGIDLNKDFEFDPSRLSLHGVSYNRRDLFNVGNAMDIIDEFLSTFDYYTEEEEIESEYLPDAVKDEFNKMTEILTEIKKQESTIDAFKAKLYAFMDEKGIKSIKNPLWCITRVEPTKSVTIDYKSIFADEIEAKRPRVARRLKERYKKVSDKKGYVAIRMNKNNKN